MGARDWSGTGRSVLAPPVAKRGLLDGRRATTHWRYAAKLKSMYPVIHVDGDRIFLSDAGIWTSTRTAAGIDMTLALIEEDLGREIARAVARVMVVYYRRPGGQHQYSSLLGLDPESGRIQGALRHARGAPVRRAFGRTPGRGRPSQRSAIQPRVRRLNGPDARQGDRVPSRGNARPRIEEPRVQGGFQRPVIFVPPGRRRNEAHVLRKGSQCLIAI